MYNDHFGLAQAPFKITPDTKLFFAGGKRGEILQALIYAITTGEGIVKVVGEVGSGKTMLCRMLETQLPKAVEIVYLANPSLTPEDILQAISLEMNLVVDPDANRIHVMHTLQQELLRRHAANQQVVVFVEEAQAMPLATLEEIRLLSNLETQISKLLQIVLFGQPELDKNLDEPSIRQLKERITHGFYLEPLNSEQIREYVNFRLRGAGYRGPDLFKDGAYASMTRASEGLTRRVNILADKALLAAYAEDTYGVLRKHVKIAINDSQFSTRRRWPEFAVAIGLLLLACTLGWVLLAGHVVSLATLEELLQSALRREPITSSGESSDESAVASRAEQVTAEKSFVTPSPSQVRKVPGDSVPTAIPTSAVEPATVAPVIVPQNLEPNESSKSTVGSAGMVTELVSKPPAGDVIASQSLAVATAAASTLGEGLVGIAVQPVVDGAQLPLVPPSNHLSGEHDGVTVVESDANVSTQRAVISATGALDKVPGGASEASVTLAKAASQIDLGMTMSTEIDQAGATIPSRETASVAEIPVAESGGVSAPPADSQAAAGTNSTTRVVVKSVVADFGSEESATEIRDVSTDSVGSAESAGVDAPAINDSSLLESRLAQTRAWMHTVSSSHYSIQLLLTDVTNRDNLEEFLRVRERAGELDDIYVYETEIGTRARFGVLYHIFPSFSQARRFLANLPEDLSRYRPFVRNMSDVVTLR